MSDETYRGDRLREVADLLDRLDSSTPLPQVDARNGTCSWHLAAGSGVTHWRAVVRDIVATFNVDLETAHIAHFGNFQTLEDGVVLLYVPTSEQQPLDIDVRAVARGEE